MRGLIWLGVVSWGLAACGSSERDGGDDADGRSGTAGMATAGSAGDATSGRTGEASGGDSASGGRAGSTASGGAGTGGSAGDSGGTSSGGAAGTSGGGRLEDPEPADPDLNGLVPTSSSWLLFSEQLGPGSPLTSSLEVLDLESGERHPANPRDVVVAIGSLSPDQKTFVFSDANADATERLSVVRLTQNGFVPAVAVRGYENVRGYVTVPHWDESSRFFSAPRGGSESDGVDVVDAVLGVRLGGFEFEPSFGDRFSPRGYYFAFWHDIGESERESAFARVVRGGVSTPTILPAGSFAPSFSRDGRRAVFAYESDGVRTARYVDLPGPDSSELVVTADDETLVGGPEPGPDDSVIVDVRSGDQDVYQEVFFDGRPRRAVSDPTLDVVLAFHASDSVNPDIYAFDYDGALDFVSLEPFARHRLPGVTTMIGGYWSTGVVGNAVYYRDEGRVRAARVDASGDLIDGPISEMDEEVSVCNLLTVHQPSNRLTYLTKDDAELVLVDLESAPPAVVGRVSASSAGATLGCPIWLSDDSALAVSEFSDAGSRVYFVRWDGATPEEPELVLESAQELHAYAFSY